MRREPLNELLQLTEADQLRRHVGNLDGLLLLVLMHSDPPDYNSASILSESLITQGVLS